MSDERLKIVKYINDPVYGGIAITQMELEIIDTPIFQRLRGLRQLARVNFVFPGAEHSRYVHSLGVLYIMGLMTEHLLKQGTITEDDVVKMRTAALLHDIGHYPLSHLGESVYSYCKDNKNANNIVQSAKKSEEKHLYEMTSAHTKSAHHEHLGKYIVIHNQEIKGILEKYGLVDLQYLVRLLMVVEDSSLPENNKVLACNKKGQHVVEHFLMSRYFHYSQVIFHKTNAAFEGMVKCMYIKLVQSGNFLYNSLEEIHASVNNEEFLKFNDSFLDVSLKEYYDKTNDEEYKRLYEMYRDRIRPKVIFELKDLYEESPSQEFAVLKWKLKKNPDKITQIIGSNRWGYQIVPITIEKIHNSYKVTEKNVDPEDLREAVKLYDSDSKKISYLAGDKLSIVSKLANYKSEFIRIYVLEEKGKKYDYEKIHQELKALITS